MESVPGSGSRVWDTNRTLPSAPGLGGEGEDVGPPPPSSSSSSQQSGSGAASGSSSEQSFVGIVELAGLVPLCPGDSAGVKELLVDGVLADGTVNAGRELDPHPCLSDATVVAEGPLIHCEAVASVVVPAAGEEDVDREARICCSTRFHSTASSAALSWLEVTALAGVDAVEAVEWARAVFVADKGFLGSVWGRERPNFFVAGRAGPRTAPGAGACALGWAAAPGPPSLGFFLGGIRPLAVTVHIEPTGFRNGG